MFLAGNSESLGARLEWPGAGRPRAALASCAAQRCCPSWLGAISGGVTGNSVKLKDIRRR